MQTWISENCDEFREMQIMRHAIYVGTMIGPDGHPHRWDSTPRFMRFLCCALLDLFVRQSARYRVAACSTTLSRDLEKISTARGHNCTPLFALSTIWEKRNSLFHPWPLALRMHLILFVGWTVMTHLTKSHKTKSRRLPLVCFWTSCINKTLLGLFLVVPQESWDRSVVIVLLTSCTT